MTREVMHVLLAQAVLLKYSTRNTKLVRVALLYTYPVERETFYNSNTSTRTSRSAVNIELLQWRSRQAF